MAATESEKRPQASASEGKNHSAVQGELAHTEVPLYRDLGPYSRNMPGALWGPSKVGAFLWVR